MTPLPYALLADAILVLHFAVVIFVVGGLAAVLMGNRRGWRWVNGFRFRIAHLVAVGFIVAQTWLNQICPLTALESWLRMQAGEHGYRKSFIEDWVHAVLYYEGPPWVFALVYTAFGLLVLAAWWLFPPYADHTDRTNGV